ncbi:hypothetical protein [Caldimonas tepidiphila]|uniref:hypothetical protein n=1 Tax=Caldimonas tepidiphila TaxID=2315841 RepID=UPI000E5C4A64|nr:hypothetical protein [Caldimonas tepidiphila]
MKHLSIALGAAALFAASLPASAQQARDAAGAMQGSTRDAAAGPVVWVNTNVVSGTITEIHRGQRMFTARTDDGRMLTMAVGRDVNNFDTLKQGDQVSIRYTEAEAIALAKRTSERQQIGEIRSTVESFASAQAPAGSARPGMSAAERTTMVANVFDIDRSNGILTLRGTSGEPVDIRVDPKALQQISKNDQVVISYLQSTAVAIEPNPGARVSGGPSNSGGRAGSRDANR